MTAKKRAILGLVAITCGVAVITAIVVWVARIPSHSPRLDALHQHLHPRAKLDDFRRAAERGGYTMEPEANCSWGHCYQVALDGSKAGKWLRLHFYDDGELQWAGIIDNTGEVEKCLLAVDKK